ncbi:HlyD family type I secretion periplasmic adaptor subunit [Azospirillum doebereinerae]|uniref:Membrane fusion protein (MFP) family protein n=1 Tax=Azospirillum doebereinerae TaxID=92933 RepID=A0A433JE74_9PROT|nr:HlyD family type I secretion periplasmic adaptor subunit [Azospirillum doebereinerae]RUQ75206.1 HlyD family type I secretion periplasmic adaptor subunit [Azospirillum doebereinerae]
MTAQPAFPPARAERIGRSDRRSAEQAINDFQSETAEITGSADPFAARAAVLMLSAMVLLGLGLASVMKLDRIVEAPGRMVVKSSTIVVQPLETSIIRSIEVREGQVVRRGEVLATLDPTILKADEAQLERQFVSLTAEVSRLQAELDGKPYRPEEKDAYYRLQESIWRHRQAELQSKLANFDQRIETAKATLAGNQENIQHYRSRLGLLTEVESMRLALEKSQTGSRINALMASDTRVEVLRNMKASEGAALAATHELEALRADRESYFQQWQSAAVQDLVNRSVDLSRVREDLGKAAKRRELVEMRAVEDAVVLEVGRYSVGSVLQSGEKLFILVPAGAPLEIEADITAADQGFVKVGDKVEVKLDAYRYMEHGTAKGTVRSVSEDSFATDRAAPGAARFYKARISLDEVALRDVPSDFRLVPGMTLVSDIVVGSRTLIWYFLDRVLTNASEGMREP